MTRQKSVVLGAYLLFSFFIFLFTSAPLKAEKTSAFVNKPDTLGCSCFYLETLLSRGVVEEDSTGFYLSLWSTYGGCFEYVTIQIDTGLFLDYSLLLPGWTVTPLPNNRLRLEAPSDYLPLGIVTPLRFRLVNPAGHYDVLVQAHYFYEEESVWKTCDQYFSFDKELNDCCPAGYVPGPNLVVNGDFSAGNTGFTSDYTFSPWGPMAPGGYSVRNSKNLFEANYDWFGTGYDGDPDNNFMIVDSWFGSTYTVWRQSFSLDKDSAFTFCFWADNLLRPQRNYGDPFIETRLVGPNGANYLLRLDTLPETPNAWKKISAPFTVPFSGVWTLEIRSVYALVTGHDFAIDNINLHVCRPNFDCSTVEVDFTTEYFGCQKVRFVATAEGAPPFMYFWSNGATGPTMEMTLSCAEQQFCVTVTDAYGCTAVICKSVATSDDTPPQIVCPNNLTVYELTDWCLYPGPLPAPQLTDDCYTYLKADCFFELNGVVVPIVPATQFPPGIHTIVCRGVDDCNNQSPICSYQLTVLDTLPPKLTCPESKTYLGATDASGNCTAAVNLLFDADDECFPISYQWTLSGATTAQGSGGIGVQTLNEGLTNIQITIADAYGNSTSCSSSVSVSCDACNCGGFSGLVYAAAPFAPLIPFDPETDTIEVNCLPALDWRAGGFAQCEGNICSWLNAVEWQLRDPDNIAVLSGQTLAGPAFSITINSINFEKNGFYRLDLRLKCGEEFCSRSIIIRSKCGSFTCGDDNLVQNGDFSVGTPTGTDETICFADHWCGIWPHGSSASTGDFYNVKQNTINGVWMKPSIQGQVGAMWCRFQQNQKVWREGIMNALKAPIPKNSGEYEISFKLACGSERFGWPRLSIFGINTTGLATGQPPTDGSTPLNTALFPGKTPVELVSYAIPAECNEFFKELSFTFNSAILPQEGINYIFFTRSDDTQDQIGGVYIAIDDVCLQQVTNVSTSEKNHPAGFVISPNPGTGQFHLSLPEAPGAGTLFRILDLQGRIVGEFAAQTGVVRQTFDAANLSAGMYLLQWISGKGLHATERFVKE